MTNAQLNSKAARKPTTMTKKKEIELARKFFDLIFREVENGEDVIYDFINPECRYKTLCDKLNNETVKEVLELGFKQKYGEEWHGGRGEQDNVNPLYDAKAVGNAAAMREVLEALSAWANIVKDNPKDKTAMECVGFVETVVSSALAAPPRNCDVGNEEEQAQRIDAFCKSHGTDQNGCYRCEECPLLEIDRCELKWAQMPYEANEKGEVDDSNG